MKYTSSNAPKDVEIWGCAYSTNYTEKSMALKKEPVLGMIVSGENRFYELNRRGAIKQSSKVYSYSRVYADTYEEAVELYNENVDRQIKFLEGLIQKCAADKIY